MSRKHIKSFSESSDNYLNQTAKSSRSSVTESRYVWDFLQNEDIKQFSSRLSSSQNLNTKQHNNLGSNNAEDNMKKIIQDFVSIKMFPLYDSKLMLKLLSLLQVILAHILNETDFFDKSKTKIVIGLECPICSKLFKSIDYLDSHILNKHSEYSVLWKTLRSYNSNSETTSPIYSIISKVEKQSEENEKTLKQIQQNLKKKRNSSVNSFDNTENGVSRTRAHRHSLSARKETLSATQNISSNGPRRPYWADEFDPKHHHTDEDEHSKRHSRHKHKSSSPKPETQQRQPQSARSNPSKKRPFIPPLQIKTSEDSSSNSYVASTKSTSSLDNEKQEQSLNKTTLLPPTSPSKPERGFRRPISLKSPNKRPIQNTTTHHRSISETNDSYKNITKDLNNAEIQDTPKTQNNKEKVMIPPLPINSHSPKSRKDASKNNSSEGKVEIISRNGHIRQYNSNPGLSPFAFVDSDSGSMSDVVNIVTKKEPEKIEEIKEEPPRPVNSPQENLPLKNNTISESIELMKIPGNDSAGDSELEEIPVTPTKRKIKQHIPTLPLSSVSPNGNQVDFNPKSKPKNQINSRPKKSEK